MNKKVKLLSKKAIPVWLLVLALVVCGAGAAVGTILTGNVIAEVPVTISQALECAKPVVHSGLFDESSDVDNMPQSVDALDGNPVNNEVAAAYCVAPDRSIGAVNDEQTAFQFAAEIDQHDWYVFYVPLKNASNQDMVCKLKLVFPMGISVEAMDTKGAVVENMVRTGYNTWKFDLDSSADKMGVDDAIWIVVAASDTIAPGFYTVHGEIVQISY